MEYRLSSLTEFPPFPPLNTPPRTARLIYFPVDRVSRREKEKGAAGLMRSYFDFSTSPRLFFARPPFNRVLGSRSMESYAYSFAEMERIHIYTIGSFTEISATGWSNYFDFCGQRTAAELDKRGDKQDARFENMPGSVALRWYKRRGWFGLKIL